MATEKIRKNNAWVDVKDNGIGSQIEKSISSAMSLSGGFADIVNIDADASTTYIVDAEVSYKYNSNLTTERADIFRIVGFTDNNTKAGKRALTFRYPTATTGTFYVILSGTIKGYPKYGIDAATGTNNSIQSAKITLTKIG